MADNYEPYFRFFPNYLKAAQEISDPVIRCEIYEGIAGYVFSGGTWPKFEHETAAAVCKSLRLSLDKSINISKKCKKAGDASGEVRASNASEQAGNMDEHAGTCGNMDEHAGTEERSKKEEGLNEGSKSFKEIPPALDEVKAYFSEQGFLSNPDAFFNHYEANGWVVSRGQPMKDWGAAARYWESNRPQSRSGSAGNAQTFAKYDQNVIELDATGEHAEQLKQWNNRPNPS